MNDKTTSPRRFRSRNGIVLLLLILMIGVYLAWSIARPAFFAAKGRRLVETKNVAIGHLENELTGGDGYAQAASGFESLIHELPEERLGRQNLAICRLLQFQSRNVVTTNADRAARDEAARTCRSAIDDLLAADQNAAGCWLAAQLAQGLNETTPEPRFEAEAVKWLKQATRLAPASPAYWFSLFELQQVARDQREWAEAPKSLARAYALAPSNLRLLTERLVVQAEQHDPQIADMLAQAEKILEATRASIQLRNDVDVLQLVQEANAARRAGDWAGVLQRTRGIRDAFESEKSTRFDLRELNPHPLEFVVHDFSDAFHRKYRPARLKPGDSVGVTLRRQPVPALDEIKDLRDAVLTDFDLDGRLDLVVLSASELLVLQRSARDRSWTVVTRYTTAGSMRGMAVADLDGDQHGGASKAGLRPATTPEFFDADDIVLFGESGIEVLRNDRDSRSGAAALIRRPQVEAVQAIRGISAGIFVDIERDGDQDLVLSTDKGIRLLRNMGDSTLAFTDASRFSVLPENAGSFTSLVAVDWDRDADIDVLLGGPGQGPMGILENIRHGQFRFSRLGDGFFHAHSTQAMEVLDCDGNRSWDVAAAGRDGLQLVQSSNPRPGTVVAIRASEISPDAHIGLMAWDYDNDSFTDLVAWDDERIRLFRGQMDGEFQQAAVNLKTEGNIRVCRNGDADGDGDLDLVVVTDAGIMLYDNVGGNQNHWIQLRAWGGSGSQGTGIGSLVELKCGPQYQARVVRGQRTHFGLGQQLRPDVLRIMGTNGTPQNIIKPRVNSVVKHLPDAG